MNAIWKKVQTWAASKGGWSHAMVLVYLGAAALIDGVPQVHTIFVQVWAVTPHWLVEIIAAIGPVIAFYKSTSKAKTLATGS